MKNSHTDFLTIRPSQNSGHGPGKKTKESPSDELLRLAKQTKGNPVRKLILLTGALDKCCISVTQHSRVARELHEVIREIQALVPWA